MFRAKYFSAASILGAVLSLPTYAQQLIIYPSKGQTAEQHRRIRANALRGPRRRPA
jgi:hypothetical protein